MSILAGESGEKVDTSNLLFNIGLHDHVSRVSSPLHTQYTNHQLIDVNLYWLTMQELMSQSCVEEPVSLVRAKTQKYTL